MSTRGEVLTAYVLEWTPHHLDLIAHLPGAAGPPAQAPAHSRASLEKIAGTAFPASFTDADALLVGTGRRGGDRARRTRRAPAVRARPTPAGHGAEGRD